MSLASDLNTGFTLAAMNPKRGASQMRADLREELRVEGHLETVTRLSRRTPGMNLAFAAPYGSRGSQRKVAQMGFTETQTVLQACSLEHQAGAYRAFRRFDGMLLHSHELRIEVIRRTARDGYHFTHQEQ
jgi:hypothetical protein